MNRTSAGFPWLPSRDYADRGGARLHVVYPAVEQMPPPPEFVGSLRVDMLRYLDPHTPDLGVLELSQPLVYGKHGWIFSHDGFLPLSPTAGSGSVAGADSAASRTPPMWIA
jgi:hypothetical protein